MKESDRTTFSERLKVAAEAKQALVAKLRPKPTVASAQPIDRAAEKKAELAQVRKARVVAKAAKEQAATDAKLASAEHAAGIEAAALAEKRGDRKERKALTKAEAKEKRDARYAARKAR